MSRKQEKKSSREDYSSSSFDFYSDVKEISENNEHRIRSAKQAREKLDGANFPQKQCKGILDTIDRNHYIHMTICYKKFNFCVGSQKKQSLRIAGLEDSQFLYNQHSHGSIRTIAISIIKLESTTRDRWFY